jgi:hypothetical protein
MRVKLAIGPPTTKSQESPQFPHVQVTCNVLLKIFQQGLQLCLRSHLNQRSARKVMDPQSRENPSCENFGTPIWESQDKMTFGCWSCGQAHSIL